MSKCITMSIEDVKSATLARGNYELYQRVMNCGDKDWEKNTVQVCGDMVIELEKSLAGEPVERPPDVTPKTDPDGPGSIFADWMEWIGIPKGYKCGCAKTQAIMDANGPEWCLANLHGLCKRIEQNMAAIKNELLEKGEKEPIAFKLYNRPAAKVAIIAACTESKRRKSKKS